MLLAWMELLVWLVWKTWDSPFRRVGWWSCALGVLSCLFVRQFEVYGMEARRGHECERVILNAVQTSGCSTNLDNWIATFSWLMEHTTSSFRNPIRNNSKESARLNWADRILTSTIRITLRVRESENPNHIFENIAVIHDWKIGYKKCTYFFSTHEFSRPVSRHRYRPKLAHR